MEKEKAWVPPHHLETEIKTLCTLIYTTDHFLKGCDDCLKFSEDWEKVNSTILIKKSKRGQFGQLLAGQPHFKPWKDEGANNSESHFQTCKVQERDWKMSAWIYKRRMMVDKFHIFWHEKTGLEYMEQTVDVVYLYFSKAFDAVSHHIIVEKLMKGNYVDRNVG